MESRLFHQCQDLLRKFIDDPLCSYYFKDPFVPGSPGGRQQYLDIIGGHPMDLSKVRTNMKEKGKHYKDFSEWAADMTLIFENAIKYNRGHWIEGLARYYKRKVENFAARVSKLSEEDYAEQVAKAHAEYLEVLAHPPSGCELRPTCKTVESLGKGFQEASLSLLVDKLNALGKSCSAEAANIVGGDIAKNGQSPIEVDVGKLSDDVVANLWALVRQREANSE